MARKHYEFYVIVERYEGANYGAKNGFSAGRRAGRIPCGEQQDSHRAVSRRRTNFLTAVGR
jgi:hypothetical protein